MKELFLEEASEEITPSMRRNEAKRKAASTRVSAVHNSQRTTHTCQTVTVAPVHHENLRRSADTDKKTTKYGRLFAAPTAFAKIFNKRIKTNAEYRNPRKKGAHAHTAPKTHITKRSVRRILVMAAAIVIIAAAVTCTALFAEFHNLSTDIPDIQLGANISLDSGRLMKIAEAMKNGDTAAAAKYTEEVSPDRKTPETDSAGDIIVKGEAASMLSSRGMSNTASNGRYNVTINFYQRDPIKLTTSSVTYGDLFAKAGVTIGESDRIYVGLGNYITEDTVIAVDTVEYRTLTGTEPIPFDTEYEDVRTIARGSTSQKRAGVNGTKQIGYYCEFVNGVEMTRTAVSETVVEYPTSRILYRGIGGTINGHSYSYYIDVKATTYTGGGTTASGLPATENVIAVDPRVISLGTKVYVAGSYGDFGVRIAADTGGSIKGNLIDIYLDPGNPYFGNFGWRSMRVYILG